MRWSRLAGIDVDVLVGEHGERPPPPMVLDRLAVALFEVGMARVLTRDGERELRGGMSRTLLPGEVILSRPLSPYTRFTMALLPSSSHHMSFTREMSVFAGDLPPVVDSPSLAGAMLALKQVALDHPRDDLAADEVWSSVVENVSLAARSHVPDEPRHHRSSEPVVVTAVRDYLREHASEPVRLSDLVELTGLTRPYLIKAFREATGLPPHQYLTRLRVARACDMMMNGVPGTQAGLACGFADQSHFSRWFHRVLETSPSDFFARAAHRASKRDESNTLTSSGCSPRLPR